MRCWHFCSDAESVKQNLGGENGPAVSGICRNSGRVDGNAGHRHGALGEEYFYARKERILRYDCRDLFWTFRACDSVGFGAFRNFGGIGAGV